MRTTPAAGALLTGLTTLTAVAGCVAVSPDAGTGPGPVPGVGRSVPTAPGPAAVPLPGREVLATIYPAPRPQRVPPPPSDGPDQEAAADPDTERPAGPAPDPPAPAPPPDAPDRPARTARPPATPPPPTADGALDVCALAGDYGRWAPGSREAAACADYFER